MTDFIMALIWLVPVLGTCQLLLLLDNLARFKKAYSLKDQALLPRYQL